MSAPSDGARADARKRLALSIVEGEGNWYTDAELAGVIADAKAGALREAAKEIADDAKDVYWRDDSTFHASQRWALTDTAPDWLRDRAKRIERESGR